MNASSLREQARGQLLGCILADQRIHNVFGVDGNRIAEFLYDPLTLSSSLIREYIWMNGRAVAVIEAGQVYLIRTDHIDRPVFATDMLGSVVWKASYEPFGGVHGTTGTPIDLRFPGQWFQAESGLHQNWMCDYDPTTGRYIQADPLGLVDGASMYGYAMQNPGRYVGPTGEAATVAAGAAIGSFGGPIGTAVGAGIGLVATGILAGNAINDIMNTMDYESDSEKRAERARIAIDNGQCPDPCDDAHRRLHEAKNDADTLRKRGFKKGFGCLKRGGSGRVRSGLSYADINERIRI